MGDTFAPCIYQGLLQSRVKYGKGEGSSYRIIKDATETGAFGLGEPIDIWAVKIVNEKPEIHNLTSDEIGIE